jgi:putative redox protein
MNANPNEFSNDDITVTFNPRKCINAEKCAKGLPGVFRQAVIPWVKLDGATAEEIINQVKKCPSGALQCYRKSQEVA